MDFKSRLSGEQVQYRMDGNSLNAAVCPVPAHSPLPLKEQRRRSVAISRKPSILRAYGLFQKLPHTNRYQLTPHARLAITAILAIDRTSIGALNQLKMAA